MADILKDYEGLLLKYLHKYNSHQKPVRVCLWASLCKGTFHQLRPFGRVGLVVAMCVCLSVCSSVCLMSSFHVIFLRGRTGAESALSVDWCDLDLDLDLDLDHDLDLE